MTRLAQIGALIAGERMTGDTTYEVTDPNDGSTIALVQDAGADVASLAADAAVEAAPQWARVALDVRREVLARTADALAVRRDALVELAIADTGARRAVAADMQVDAAIARLRSWAAKPADLLAPQPPDAANGLGVTLARRPVGVVACISPYNFPLLAMVSKVAPALFAGNAVVLKPAPQDPLLVSELADALTSAVHAVDGPAGAVNFVVGSSPESGAALVEHPGVRGVSFTGSTAVGAQIYRTAAPHMKRLLLELGGKGALILRADADLDAVLPAITRAWTYHAGQVCLTPSRILAPDSLYDDLLDRLRARLATIRHGDPRDADTDVAPIISAAQRDRIETLVQSAADEGLGVERTTGLPSRGFHTAATLVTDAGADSTIMREEVFGPVITTMRVRDDEHAIEVANSTRYGLYDYVFSADRDAAHAIATRLESAQVGVNTITRHPEAPFGGNKLSGIGRTGGSYALDTYTDLQAFASPV